MENNKNTEGAVIRTVEKAASSAAKEIKKQKLRKKIKRFRKSRFCNVMYDKGVFYFLLSFLIPAAIMTFAFAQNGIYPFGNNQMLVVDQWHQYYPFFRVEREKLLTGGSFLYSWQNGLGSNFLSLISYYEASPLNWISIFFPADYVREAFTLILILKIGFSGAFFSCFLRYTYGRKDFSICIFSTMFALCSYTLGYYWNVMWFDTIALFPLVMLGIVAICREGKWKTYTFALALSLFSNYYIAFFTCIFSIFMFAAAGIIEFKGVKNWIYKFWIMLRSSVLGTALAAVMLLPAYFGLQLTHSANNKFPKDTVYYESWTKICSNLISYNKPAKVEGLPNFACGMLAVLLFGVFLLTFCKKGIKIREKFAVLLMLALIVVSCNMNKLNYIWHGFHFTNQIPYRFAFIFSFVLVAAAFRAYDIMLRNGIKVYQLILMVLAPAAVFVLYKMSQGDDFEFKGAFRSSLIITAAMWFIFIAAKIFPFKYDRLRNTLMTLTLAAAVFTEFVNNAKTGVETVSTTDRKSYPTNNEQVQEMLDYTANTDPSPFYRTEMTKTYTLNDSALYGYNGLSQFSSTANVNVTTLCKRLGLYAMEAGNRYYYRTSTPVVNALFGIKYIIKRDGDLISEEMSLSKINSADNSDSTDTVLYQNKYALSLGFMMDERILELPDQSGSNPFEYQNSIIRLATGTDEPIFTAQPVALVSYNGMQVNKHGFGDYSFSTDQERTGVCSATYSFNGKEGAYLYGYAGSTGGACDSLKITSDGIVVDSGKLIESYPLVFPMGNGQEGSEAKIEISTNADKKSGNYKLMVYALDQKRFEDAYNSLADEQLDITSFSDAKIKGTVNAKKDGVMFLSMPYEKGWKVYIDGKRAETFEVLNAMTGVKVSEGSHDIELRYTPEGFVPGVIISLSSAGIIIFLIWFERRRKLKRAEKSELCTADDELSEDAHTGEIYDQDDERKEQSKTESTDVKEEEHIVEETMKESSETDITEENDEKSQGDDGISGNSLSRLPETEQCGDGSGNA